MSSPRQHWQQVYVEQDPTEVSWFEQVPTASLAMIEELDLPRHVPILDLGGGASGLAGELLRRGYSDVTVADISASALERAQTDLGADADKVSWIVADARTHDFGRSFALWHDRALFHFMVDVEDRRQYLEVLARSVEPNGHVIMATFGPQGPNSCSGLPVARYGAKELASVLAPTAEFVSAHIEDHRTPSGNAQQFLYAHFKT